MDIKELRIGNLIYDNGGNIIAIFLIHRDYAYIDKSKFDDCCNYDIENGEIQSSICLEECKPIPLTEEWLLKFGFERRNQSYYWMNDICVHYNNSGLYSYNVSIKGVVIVYDITKVHQLQNLYFALTGQELIPK